MTVDVVTTLHLYALGGVERFLYRRFVAYMQSQAHRAERLV